MKSELIIAMGIVVLLCGCTEIRPLDATVTIEGNPQTWHTAFERGNNSINITIKQEPSILLYYPSDELHADLSLVCYNDIDGTFAFRVNSTLKLFYDDEWIERKLGQGQTILKYKKIHGFSSFNENDLNLSYSGKFFSCRIKPIEFSSFSLHFEEYIDGVKVEDSKDYCNRFWEEWFSYHIGIDCREHCELITDSEDIKKFFEVPELLISEKCFDRWW